MFVKVELRVLFENITDADYYREEAEKNDIETKMRFLKRADELDQEEMPSNQELIDFLTQNDEGMSTSRFEEMIDVCTLWHHTYNSKIYLKNDTVMISFVLETDPNSPCASLEDVVELVNNTPFEKSRIGGHVGNYCKFPSRKNNDDLLGELDVDAFVTQVADITGETEIIQI